MSDARSTDVTVEHLVIGAGITGLAYANAVRTHDDDARLLVIERDTAVGGYCKTIHQDGFVWDYSGHFFHFKHPEIENWLKARMPKDEDIRTVEKRSFIHFPHESGAHFIDFPFQKNIHQLPKEDFLRCLHDLYFREASDENSFKSMVTARFGHGIADRFLIPYNEKLYATDLDTLDKDAMGRFFPNADIDDVIRQFVAPDNASYNATFTYPRGGAIRYVEALMHDLRDDDVVTDEALLKVDVDKKVATTSRRKIRFSHLVSSAPLPALLNACDVESSDVWSWNKVLVFNLGFEAKGDYPAPERPHWIYYPDRALRFYRVGFYDNIMGDDRLSLYVEIGARNDEILDVERERARVLADLERAGVTSGDKLVSWHSVVMNPAYVHITTDSVMETDRQRATLSAGGVHSVGRYGGWTYCAIEDNIVEARALADEIYRSK